MSAASEETGKSLEEGVGQPVTSGCYRRVAWKAPVLLFPIILLFAASYKPLFPSPILSTAHEAEDIKAAGIEDIADGNEDGDGEAATESDSSFNVTSTGSRRLLPWWIVCSPDWIYSGGTLKLKFCVDKRWSARPRAAVIGWHHGARSLIAEDHFVSMGYIFIHLEGRFIGCGWKTQPLMKDWLPTNGNAYLKALGNQFSLANEFFIAGYSRAGMCAGNTAIRSVQTGNLVNFKGAITLGVFRWLGDGRDYNSRTVPWLSFSCGTTDGQRSDYTLRAQKRITEAKDEMGNNFIDVHWSDCNHVSYLRHKQEIKDMMKQFIESKLTAPAPTPAPTPALPTPVPSQAPFVGACNTPKFGKCIDTRCCADPGFSCFEKDQWYAQCRASCTPGISADAPPQYQTPWSCAVLQSP